MSGFYCRECAHLTSDPDEDCDCPVVDLSAAEAGVVRLLTDQRVLDAVTTLAGPIPDFDREAWASLREKLRELS